jgi:GGDEF domain-containing protein
MLDMPSFYSVFVRAPAERGVVVVTFLATFMPVGSRHGHAAVDLATSALAEIVARSAPPGSVAGYLSRLAYGVLIPKGSREDGEALARTIQELASTAKVELSPGAPIQIEAAVGVVELDDSPKDHWQVLEEAADAAAADLRNRYPADWQYPVLVYPR